MFCEESGVLDVVNDNKILFKPWEDLVDSAFLNFRYGSMTDENAQQENDDAEEEVNLQDMKWKMSRKHKKIMFCLRMKGLFRQFL